MVINRTEERARVGEGDTETIGTRLQRLIDRRGISQRQFAREINELAANVNNWVRGTEPPVRLLEKVAARYPEINLRWLVTGEGPIIERERSEGGLIEALTRHFVMTGGDASGVKVTKFEMREVPDEPEVFEFTAHGRATLQRPGGD